MSVRAKSTRQSAQHRARTQEPKLKRRRIMPSCNWRASFLAGSVLAGVIGVTLTGEAAAQQKASPPDFSANQAGWITMGGDLLPVPGSPKPITWDPAHPYVPNNVGKQPTYMRLGGCLGPSAHAARPTERSEARRWPARGRRTSGSRTPWHGRAYRPPKSSLRPPARSNSLGKA
jgi:hypothetical protein